MKKSLLFPALLLSVFITKAQRDETAIAMQLVSKHRVEIGLSTEDLKNIVVSDSYFDKTSGAQLVYLQQSYKDIIVHNQLQVLAFKNDQLMSTSGGRIQSIEKLVGGNKGIPKISAQEAIYAALTDRKLEINRVPNVITSEQNGRKIIFDNMDISRENITAELMWVPLEKKVVLAWQIYVIPLTSSDYWMIRVSALDKSIIGINNLTVSCNWGDPTHKNSDLENNINQKSSSQKKTTAGFVYGKTVFDFMQITGRENSSTSPTLISNASYRVIPFPAESPLVAQPALVSDPWLAAPGNATSLYWHNNGAVDYTNTKGNNVYAADDIDGNDVAGNYAISLSSTSPLNFDFTPSFTVTPTQTTPVTNQQFNITNLFYWNNIIHDITYQYGFDEVAGNFQYSNQGRGGAGNDYVIADAQDGSGTNNANFSTPADGGRGRMQMFLWSGTPQKDGDVDNGIITHEFAHGISNRLTGGPAQAGCLYNAEQMGEGWSDYYALMYTQNWATSDTSTGRLSPRSMGVYAAGGNIRTKRYCTNWTINNLAYSNSATQMGESHNRGEVWCAALWDMTWNIIKQVNSINPNIYDANGGGGNTIALKLVTQGMKLQPCSPGFIDGRDAILQADQLLYNGAYSCAIREAFRRRGMGAFASQGSSESVTDQVPDFSAGSATVSLTQSVTQVPEGQNITYYNKVTTGSCAGVTNFLLTDTLPTNVTYVSGGTYNAAKRVVSFPVTLAAGQTQVYSFTVLVNTGSYFPTVNLFEDSVSTSTVAPRWTATNTVTGVAANWIVSSARSYSPNRSYYAQNLDVASDERLTLITPISLGATPPNLTFRHWYNTESTYDGGILDISSDGGTTWTTNISSLMLTGGYNSTMDASTTLSGKPAWSGSSNNKFIKTKVNLASYANKNILLRFRFVTDVGTNAEGWYVDDIAIKNQAVVEMQSNLYTSSNVNVAISDTITIILPAVTSSFTFSPVTPVNVTCGSAANPATLLSNTVGVFTTPIALTYTSSMPGTTVTLGTLSLTPGNSTTVTLNNTDLLSPGTDTVIVTGVAGSITQKDTILFIIQPGTAPTISSAPTDQTVCAGSNATFTVTASGSGTLSYQWQESTNGGSAWSNVGTNSNTYTITAPTASQTGYKYKVIISTLCGTTTSNIVTLTVNTAPAITTNPSNASVCEGSSNTFTAAATGTGISYQWQVSTGGGFSNVGSGGTAASYTLNSITLGQTGYQYQVVVTGTCPTPATSTPATLTVTGAPGISVQPADVTNCVGATATFSVTASGSGLSYQWQVNTGGGFGNVASNGTSATYSVTSSTALSGNSYRVIVSGAGCSTSTTSNAATLTVNTLPSITTQPTGNTLCEGSNITFTSAATGTNIAYQWQVSTNGGSSWSNVASAGNGATYTLNSITAGLNNSQYHVVVSGTCTPSVTSSNATLIVSTAPSISTNPSDATVCAESNHTFNVAATGSNLSYLWQVSTDGGSSFNNVASGGSNATYTINNTNVSQSGYLYQVIVSGTCTPNTTSLPATLTVNALPDISISVAPDNVVYPGQTVTITATSNPITSTYTWLLNNQAINQTGVSITVGNNELGAYTASVTDLNGCTNTSAAIIIKDTTLNYTFIYPNPNNGIFHVRFDGVPIGGKPRIITIYDSKGSRVYSKSYTITTSYQNMDVNVRKLSRGTYMLVLSDVNGTTLQTGKVIID